MSILIAEDNLVSAVMLEVSLQKQGFHTVMVDSGQQALECLQKIPDIQLVITDLGMPEIGGLELLKRIQENPDWSVIPVIVATAKADRATVEEAVALGCRHYIVKPIKAAELIHKVQEVLQSQKLVLRDSAQVINELGINRKAYKEIVCAFAVVVGEKVALLEQEASKGSAEEPSIDLMDLWEGAVLVGAERLIDVLKKLSAAESAGSDSHPNHAIALKELQLLHGALTLHTG